MPAKNAIKTYLENSYYHLYNRGVEKRDIFQGKQDYAVFLSYLKTYLTPPPKNKPFQRLRNHADQISLLAYCLMPNHFHLLLKQNSKDGMNYFMRSLATKYSVYFNKKYKRVGPLFQGRYKGVRVKTDDQLLYLTKYIHRNPTEITRSDLVDYSYSSYRNFLGMINLTWVKADEILGFFSSSNPSLRYQSYVEETDIDTALLTNLMID